MEDGKAQEALANATGKAGTVAEGAANQLKGTAQDLYGQAMDGPANVADAARETVSSLERILRTTIEQQPYTAVAIALGIGWLLGRAHRPL